MGISHVTVESKSSHLPERKRFLELSGGRTGELCPRRWCVSTAYSVRGGLRGGRELFGTHPAGLI